MKASSIILYVKCWHSFTAEWFSYYLLVRNCYLNVCALVWYYWCTPYIRNLKKIVTGCERLRGAWLHFILPVVDIWMPCLRIACRVYVVFNISIQLDNVYVPDKRITWFICCNVMRQKKYLDCGNGFHSHPYRRYIFVFAWKVVTDDTLISKRYPNFYRFIFVQVIFV